MLNNLIKVDLHIHSKISSYKEDCDNEGKCCVTNSTVDNLDKLLSKVNDKEINLIAFSDHNRFDKNLFLKAQEIINLKRYPNIKGIVPSVEFDVKIEEDCNACHILTVFDFTSPNDLDKILEGIEADKLQHKDDYYSKDRFEKLLKTIGLSVLLIACQRKDINSKEDGHRDLSNSCKNPLEFIKTGYIDALEYQSSGVEGILLNTLSKFPDNMGVSLVAGSDCHDWEHYPMHSKNSNNYDKTYYFTIKALPSFKGLLMSFTSPTTRFKRRNPENKYIQSFDIGGKTYKLSPGFNAIIGENGSCKSTLIEGLSMKTKKTYMQKILKSNSFHCEYDQIDLIKYINQGRLTDCSQTNSELFKGEMSFKRNDNDDFEKIIKSVYTAICSKIESNITLFKMKRDLSGSSFTFNLDIEQYKYFYVHVEISNNFTFSDNKFASSYKTLLNILNEIKSEYNNNLYENSHKEKLKSAFNIIKLVYNDIRNSYSQIANEISIRNAMFSSINDYNREIKRKSNSDATQKSDYLNSKQNLISGIVNLIVESENNKKIVIPKIKLNDNLGVTVSQLNGFDFIATTKYHETADLNDEFYKNIFNTGYQSSEAVSTINQTEIAISAISGARKDNDYKTRLEKNINSFISKFESETYDVADGSFKIKTGSTLGEKSIIFYKFVSTKMDKNSILLIDQPEDNISNLKIKEELINYFNDLRDRYQIIFVTHNPLLVINLDVDNVIYLENHNGTINITDGCLEEGNILNLIANHMDGGKKAIKRRLKVYGSGD